MFSIITATYNREHCIGNTINSVLNQSFKDWELIIIDDGSTDNTPKIIGQFSDPRINYIYFNKNRGCNAARNHGIKLAKKDWVVFLDSDDSFSENALNIMAKAIGEYKFPFMCFPCKNKKEKSTVADPLFGGFVNYRDILCKGFKGEYHNLIKADLLKRFLLREDIVGGEGLTWLLITRELGRVLFIPGVTRIYEDESNDRLSNVWRNIPRIRKVYKKELDILGDEYRRHCPSQYIKKRIKYFLYCVADTVI